MNGRWKKTSKWEGQGGETQLRRRLGWLENGGKWLEENALTGGICCTLSKQTVELSRHGGSVHHLLHKGSFMKTGETYSWLKRIWFAHISSCISSFCHSVSVFFPSVSPHFYSPVLPHSLPSFTLLQIKEVVCVQTNTGWKTVPHWESRNMSPSALNVPLEQQFLWWEIMWWATVKGSGEHGWDMVKRLVKNELVFKVIDQFFCPVRSN